MSKGVLIFAHNNTDRPTDYLFGAWICATTIKNNNPDISVSLLTKDKNYVPTKQQDIYDEVIEFPFGTAEKAQISSNTSINCYQFYYATPYEQTLVLDADTLVLGKLDGLFEAARRHDLLFPHTIKDFRNVSYRVIDKLAEKNNLPQFETCAWYFNKNFDKEKHYRYEGKQRIELDTSEEDSEPFFNLLEIYLRHHKIINDQIEHNPPAGFDKNFLFSLAIDNLDLVDNIQDFGILTYLDLASTSPNWYKLLNYWIINGKLKIENYNITGIIHYGNKTFNYDELDRIAKQY